MSRRIVFTPEARDQLDALHAYVASAADAAIASGFVNGIIDHAATLGDVRHRGTARDDVRPGLRTIPWKRRVTIAFMIEKADVVVIGSSTAAGISKAFCGTIEPDLLNPGRLA